MFRFIFKLTHWLFTLLVVLLFSIGIINVHSSNPALYWLGRQTGWLYRVLPAQTNTQHTGVQWFYNTARWLGSPGVDTSAPAIHRPESEPEPEPGQDGPAI